MTLLDVHPEHLIDGFLGGRLDESEQAQLDQHLLQCDACRLEISLSRDLSLEGAAVSGSTERADELAVDRALSSMLANQVLRVPALKSLPAQRVSGRKKLATRAMVGTLLFSLGAAAAVVVMQKNSSKSETSQGAEQVAPAEPQAAPQPAQVPDAVAEGAAPESEKLARRASASEADVGVGAKSTEDTRSSDSATNSPTTPKGSKGKAVESAPVSAAELFRRATMARRAGKSAEAIATYQKLQARYPSSAEALISRLALGRLLAGSSPSLAYTQYDSYLRNGGPLRPEALVGRAKALTAMGQTARAQAAWQEVLEAAPNSIYAEQARRHLSPSQP